MRTLFLWFIFILIFCSFPAYVLSLSRPEAPPQSFSLVSSVADTLPYEKIVYTDEPGKFLAHFNSGGWELDWYEGMLVGTVPDSIPLDTIYKTYESVTYSVEDPSQLDTSENHFSAEYHTLSIIGDVVSYEMSYEGDGGVHPIGGTSYETIELGEKIEYGSGVDLTDYFAESDIFRAVLADSTITKYLPKNFRPNGLDDLIKHLNGGCDVDFSNFLKHWVIYDCTDDSAEIVFGFTFGCEVERENFTSIEITLPIPEDSKWDFQQTKKAGTYEKKMDKVQYGREE